MFLFSFFWFSHPLKVLSFTLLTSLSGPGLSLSAPVLFRVTGHFYQKKKPKSSSRMLPLSIFEISSGTLWSYGGVILPFPSFSCFFVEICMSVGLDTSSNFFWVFLLSSLFLKQVKNKLNSLAQKLLMLLLSMLLVCLGFVFVFWFTDNNRVGFPFHLWSNFFNFRVCLNHANNL